MQEVDLLNPNAPVYCVELASAIRGLQKHPGPLTQGPCLLSGMTKQQHAWHVKHTGAFLSLLSVARILMDILNDPSSTFLRMHLLRLYDISSLVRMLTMTEGVSMNQVNAHCRASPTIYH